MAKNFLEAIVDLELKRQVLKSLIREMQQKKHLLPMNNIISFEEALDQIEELTKDETENWDLDEWIAILEKEVEKANLFLKTQV